MNSRNWGPVSSRRSFGCWLALGLAQLACATLTTPGDPASTIMPVTVVVTVTPVIKVLVATPAPTLSLSPIPPTTSAELTDAEIEAGIQDAVDVYAQAYNANDPDLLARVVDQENLPFRRIVRSRFDSYQESYLAGQIEFGYTVHGIERRDFGLVLAYLRDQGGGAEAWLFRVVDDHWVLTEPTVEQIGEAQTTETEHFIFVTYPWADDVNSTLIAMMDDARANVLAVLGQAPDEKARVEILPIYGLQPFNTMHAIALYWAANEMGNDVIQVYTPDTYAFGWYDPDEGWEAELERTLTHEYTHMTHTRSFGDAGQLADWLSEGLAEYVSDAPNNLRVACRAAHAGDIIPIVDTETEAYLHKQDLMHLRSLDADIGLAYALSHSLVAYIVEEQGGLAMLWALANAYDETSNFDKALQQTLDVDYAWFDSHWRAWLKEQC